MTKKDELLLKSRGCSVLTVTPFDEKDRIDEDSVYTQIEFVVQCKVASVGAPLMVGEFQTLSEAERMRVIELTADAIKGRAPYIAGVSGITGDVAAKFAEHAEKCGADAVVAMMIKSGAPAAFSKVKAYFKRISEATTLPVMIQNASGEGCNTLTPDQIFELCASFENVSWVKEEVNPGSLSVSKLTEAAHPGLIGVYSGNGTQVPQLDTARKAVASMPSPMVCDVDQTIWELLDLNRYDEAMGLLGRVLPLKVAKATFGAKMVKEILVRRGAIKYTHCRNNAKEFTKLDMADIDRLYDYVKEYFVLKEFKR